MRKPRRSVHSARPDSARTIIGVGDQATSSQARSLSDDVAGARVLGFSPGGKRGSQLGVESYTAPRSPAGCPPDPDPAAARDADRPGPRLPAGRQPRNLPAARTASSSATPCSRADRCTSTRPIVIRNLLGEEACTAWPTRGRRRYPLSINGYASDLGEVQLVTARLDVTRTSDAVVAKVGADDGACRVSTGQTGGRGRVRTCDRSGVRRADDASPSLYQQQQ